jgi:hypothetical protein
MEPGEAEFTFKYDGKTMRCALVNGGRDVIVNGQLVPYPLKQAIIPRLKKLEKMVNEALIEYKEKEDTGAADT